MAHMMAPLAAWYRGHALQAPSTGRRLTSRSDVEVPAPEEETARLEPDPKKHAGGQAALGYP